MSMEYNVMPLWATHLRKYFGIHDLMSMSLVEEKIALARFMRIEEKRRAEKVNLRKQPKFEGCVHNMFGCIKRIDYNTTCIIYIILNCRYNSFCF